VNTNLIGSGILTIMSGEMILATMDRTCSRRAILFCSKSAMFSNLLFISHVNDEINTIFILTLDLFQGISLIPVTCEETVLISREGSLLQSHLSVAC
jgi:hypothetical protein